MTMTTMVMQDAENDGSVGDGDGDDDVGDDADDDDNKVVCLTIAAKSLNHLPLKEIPPFNVVQRPLHFLSRVIKGFC